MEIVLPENINAVNKRFQHIKELITYYGAKTVLDIGCGTGALLTYPLAQALPDVEIVGLDNDPSTINHARKEFTCPNLRYVLDTELPESEQFDCIIASEVIEHILEPGEFLLFIRSRLKENGIAVITTPNGYGPYEMTSVVEVSLDLLGVMKFLSKLPFLKKMRLGNMYEGDLTKQKDMDTMAVSPHVNFFSYKRLIQLFQRAGFTVLGFRPRAFLGGLGFQHLIRSKSALEWNSRVSDKLSPYLVSGWMFTLQKVTGVTPRSPIPYTRRLNERFRKKLNAKRWGVE